MSHLGKVAHNMVPLLVALSQDVEKEGVDVVVERLVVEK